MHDLLLCRGIAYLYSMPLFKEWDLGDDGRAAIWKVEEPEAFFAEQTGLTPDINNEKRRIEHLAGRFLLRHLEAEFPLHQIARDEHDKPRITDNAHFFSISHSWPYVAVTIDPDNEAGIDIQTWHPRIGNIKHKFLSDEEQQLLLHDPKLFTLAWSAKEAVYKWNGRRAVEFIEDLPIVHYGHDNNINIFVKTKKVPQMIFVESIMHNDFVCAYVDKAQDWAIY